MNNKILNTPPNIYFLTPDLRANFDEPKNGYTSFRRMIEDSLSQYGRSDVESRLSKLDKLFNDYRDTDVTVKSSSGIRIKRWNITTLRDQLIRILTIKETQATTRAAAIRTLEDDVKEGKRAIKWLKKSGRDYKAEEECLHQLMQAIQIRKAARAGTHAHLVSGARGSAQIVPPNKMAIESGRSRLKMELDNSFKISVMGLVLMLRILSKASSFDAAEIEAGELLYATGIINKGKHPAGYIHKVIRSKSN